LTDDEWQVSAATVIGLQNLTGSGQHRVDLDVLGTFGPLDDQPKALASSKNAQANPVWVLLFTHLGGRRHPTPKKNKRCDVNNEKGPQPLGCGPDVDRATVG